MLIKWPASKMSKKAQYRTENLDEDDVEIVEDEGVSADKNHIYFFSEVSRGSVLRLIKQIKKMDYELACFELEHNMAAPPIYLHINSFGGQVTDGLLAADVVAACKHPIHSIINGHACSAATIISVAATKRLIYPNSMMLIHQLSTAFWGKYSELLDEHQNCSLIMEKILNIYSARTKIPKKLLTTILTHDLYFDSVACLKYKLVDEITE